MRKLANLKTIEKRLENLGDVVMSGVVSEGLYIIQPGYYAEGYTKAGDTVMIHILRNDDMDSIYVEIAFKYSDVDTWYNRHIIVDRSMIDNDNYKGSNIHDYDTLRTQIMQGVFNFKRYEIMNNIRVA